MTIGPRARKVRADLLTNKLRSALAILSLAVGTTAVATMFLAATTVDESFARSLMAANHPAAVLSTAPFPAGLVDAVAAHPQVGQAEGRRLHQAQITDASGERSSMQLVAMPDFTENRIGRIAPDGGQWPPADGSIVLERATLPELGVGIGDVLAVDVPGEAPLQLTVAGSAFDVSEVAPMLGGSLRGYVTLGTIAEIAGSDDLNALYLRTAQDPASRDDAVTMVTAVRDDVLAPSGVPVISATIGEPGEHPAQNAVEFLTLAMALLALLALAVAVALVVNTVAALLAQQRTQLGVMKAIGATTRQLTIQYLAYVLLLAAVAVALSIPVSIASGRAVSGFIADLANIDLAPTGAPLAAIALQLALGVLVPVVAVVWAVRRASRTTVLDAITDRGLTATVSGRLGGSLLDRPTLLAYRNAVRSRVRLALTVVTVSLCGAVGVGVLSTGSALNQLADQVAGYADYDVALTVAEPVAVDEARALLRTDPAVTAVEGWLARQAFRLRPDGTENDGIDLTGVPTDSSLIAPTLLEGRWFTAEDPQPIVINTHLAQEESDLTVGEEVLLDVEGRQQRWRIVGIATTTLVGPVAYVPAQELNELLEQPGTADLLAIGVDSGAAPDVVAERLTERLQEAGLPVADAVTNAELREGVESMFAIVVALLLVVGGVLGVVAVIGVAGTMTLSVVEQTREIGVLRTLGASTWAVRRLMLLQGLAIAAAGAVLGVLLSVPVTLLLGAAIGDTLISAAFPFAFSWLGVGGWAFVALVIGALGATQPARMAARLTVRDTLAYE